MTPKDTILGLAARVYEARGNDLLRYLEHRVRSATDARDIAHEAFLRFIRLGVPERIKNPEAYIFRIAGNLLWEQQLRDRQEFGAVSDTPEACPAFGPADIALHTELSAQVRRALDQLLPVQRAVIILRLRDDMSFGDIAKHAGISPTMVKKHFKAALAACRLSLVDDRQ